MWGVGGGKDQVPAASGKGSIVKGGLVRVSVKGRGYCEARG